MIDNQLLEEVMYVSNKNKFINMKLIEKIIVDTVNQTDALTKSRFNGVFFEKIKWDKNVVCVCRPYMGDIIVDYQNLVKQLISVKKLSFLEYNLELITNLLHEVEHLKEPSKMNLDNFESFLLYFSNFEIFEFLAQDELKFIKYILPESFYNNKIGTKAKKLYLKIYDKNPSERLATIYSHKLLLESLNNFEGFKENYKNSFKYINKKYINQYYIGYNELRNNIPLVDYFKFIKLNLLNELGFCSQDVVQFLKLSSKKFSIEERMLYGLPVKRKETSELNKKLILTK